VTPIDESRRQAREQQRVVVAASAPLFVQACPGAGKTRIIVDRHLQSDVAPRRRGRAVASFTNVACNEIRQRCHELSRPDLVRFPHFVGTIDTFIWLYMVRPFLPADRTWRRIDSWDRIRASVAVPEKIPLSAFLFRDQITPRTTEAKLLPQTTTLSVVRKLSRDNRIGQAQDKAIKERQRYVKAGYVTGHEVRVLAVHNLQKRQQDVIALIRSRFHEVVMDEAQDCSSLDLTILEYLRDGNVPLVFVADPDQAIYEFRGADPGQVRTFGATLNHRMDLTGNWRSNPAICSLSATLRDPRHDRPADQTHWAEPRRLDRHRTVAHRQRDDDHRCHHHIPGARGSARHSGRSAARPGSQRFGSAGHGPRAHPAADQPHRSATGLGCRDTEEPRRNPAATRHRVRAH
jgi:DNA helicase II / ATP-dependent DNA helicase PcrA